MITRLEYLKGLAIHDEYYSQFVDDNVLAIVSREIGLKAIYESKDPNFNDIRLLCWDNLHHSIHMICGKKVREVGDGGYSLNDSVCIAKAAAKMLKEKLNTYEEQAILETKMKSTDTL